MTSQTSKRVVILHNFDSAEYRKLIASLRSVGLADNTIVAVTTSVTLDWKVRDLISELFLEDERLKEEGDR